MNKKIVIAFILVVCIISVGFFAFNKNNQQKKSSSVNNAANPEFRVKAAFADIDNDMIIQDKDSKDDDTNSDYVFVTFTTAVSDNKKSDGTNPFNLKNYKLDGKELPDKSKIVLNKDFNYKIIIILPNDYLKGVNSNHSLELSKDIQNKQATKISGDLSLKLPYSKSEGTAENKPASSDAKNTSNTDKTTSNSTKPTSTANNGTTAADKAAIAKNNENMPKYTVQILKSIPMVTTVAVKLDTTTPEKYKVSITGVKLELKANNENVKFFVGSLEKDYELDEVKQLIKIEKSEQK